MRSFNDEDMLSVIESICASIDTPKSLAVYICFRDDHRSLLELDITPLDYLDAEAFAKDYQAVSLLKKFKGLTTGLDTKAVALDGWRSAESGCRLTNKRFKIGATQPVEGWVESVLYRAQLKIATVLGPCKIERLLEGGRWSSGSTFDLRRNVGLDIKQSKAATVTPACYHYASLVIGLDPVWFESITGIRPDGPLCSLTLKSVRGNKHETVPKNAKTDRNIAKEPTMNIFIQCGVGSYIRDRLKRFGLDLDDQTLNQRLAQRAYSESLATVDLSAASDSISYELVMSLLPIDWGIFLDQIRSRETLVNGEWHYLSKFSSMGNGFTFELESLIFWALAESTLEQLGGRRILAVYGDDIIVPAEAYEALSTVLTYCGFTINDSKSYCSGPFYESCGKHYFMGQDVTPAFQKEKISSLAEAIRFSNRLARWSYRATADWNGVMRRPRKRIGKIAEKLYGPSSSTFRIPFGAVGDGGYLCHPADLPFPCKSHGFYCRVLVWRDRRHGARDLPLFAYKLRRPFVTFDRQGGRNVKPKDDGEYRSTFQYFQIHDLVELKGGDSWYDCTLTLVAGKHT